MESGDLLKGKEEVILPGHCFRRHEVRQGYNTIEITIVKVRLFGFGVSGWLP